MKQLKFFLLFSTLFFFSVALFSAHIKKSFTQIKNNSLLADYGELKNTLPYISAYNQNRDNNSYNPFFTKLPEGKYVKP